MQKTQCKVQKRETHRREVLLVASLVHDAVVVVVREARELDHEQHLRTREVECPAHVVHVEAVDVRCRHVRHVEDEHDVRCVLGRAELDEEVRDRGRDERVHPARAEHELRQQDTHDDVEHVLERCRRQQLVDHGQRVRGEEAEHVAQLVGGEAERGRELGHLRVRIVEGERTHELRVRLRSLHDLHDAVHRELHDLLHGVCGCGASMDTRSDCGMIDGLPLKCGSNACCGTVLVHQPPEGVITHLCKKKNPFYKQKGQSRFKNNKTR